MCTLFFSTYLKDDLSDHCQISMHIQTHICTDYIEEIFNKLKHEYENTQEENKIQKDKYKGLKNQLQAEKDTLPKTCISTHHTIPLIPTDELSQNDKTHSQRLV